MTPRPVRAGEFAALSALHGRAFDAPWSAAFLQDMAGRDGAVALCVDAPGGGEAPLAGFILLSCVVGEAEVLTLAVDPERRRGGIARALLQAAVAAVAAQGADAVWLDVAQDNAAALALYGGAGFTKVGRRRGYYLRPAPEGPVDALVLRRSLTATT